MTAAERTKRDILQALLRLVDTTPFEHVTVKDICQEAGVSRPTFYAYYRDKYDCAVYLVTRQTADVFGRLGQSTDWRSAYLATFESAQEVQPALAKLTQVEDYNSIFNTTVRASRETFHGSLPPEIRRIPRTARRLPDRTVFGHGVGDDRRLDPTWLQPLRRGIRRLLRHAYSARAVRSLRARRTGFGIAAGKAHRAFTACHACKVFSNIPRIPSN